MKEESRMVNPLFSSVLYLTGSGSGSNNNKKNSISEASETSAATTRRVQAPTVVNDQFYNQNTRSTVPEDPTSSAFIFPRTNSYCLFDGRLGHGVLDSGSTKEQRMTLLINWWQSKPDNIGRIEIKGEVQGKVKGSGGDGEKSAPPLLPECIYPETIEITEAELGEDNMLFVSKWRLQVQIMC
jgi:hypothetical protein